MILISTQKEVIEIVIRSNVPSLILNRHLNITNRSQSKVLEKLSSGFKINRAADDASGLAISEKMRAQINGLEQSLSNAQDGISLLQVAEGALSEIHNCIRRAKEISTAAANGTLVDQDRGHIQVEVDKLLKEIGHIAESTKFNDTKLLDGSCSSASVSENDKQKFINWLNGSWLGDAAKKVEDTTGWKFSNSTTLNVTFKSVGDKAVASMSGWYGGNDLTLTINTDFMTSDAIYNGTDGPINGGIPADRLITHEMVHGYMFENTSVTAMPPSWFVEGLAEGVHGASDIRYSAFENQYTNDFESIKKDFQDFDFAKSDGNEKNYSIGYIAVSYLRSAVESKSAGSFKTFMAEMNGNESFEQLVVKYTGVTDYASFITTMKNDTNVANFATDFLESKCAINLTDGKADPLDGNDALSSDVIPNSGNESAPTGSSTKLIVGSSEITVNWNEEPAEEVGAIVLQIGDTADQVMHIAIKSAKTSDLGIDNILIDSQENASKSIALFEDAINTVSQMRSALGAYQNRLEYTMNNLSTMRENTHNANSQIRDADMARELLIHAKNNILAQAGQFLSAQANQMPQMVLQLLQ